MVLGACMKPVDVKPFLEDDRVQEIINPGKTAVKVDDQTGDGLVGRDRKIEGLKPDKYYMVEKEMDADGVPVPKYNNQDSYPVYVSDAQTPGGLSPNLGVITKIKDGSINGLTNLHTYTVRAAEAFPNGTNFTYLDSVIGSNRTAAVNNGTITISGSTGTIKLVQLNTQYNGYDVMAVAVSPPALPSTSPFYKGAKKTIGTAVTSFQLEGTDTEVDYVFVRKNGSSAPDFKVLTVKVEPPPDRGATITITSPEIPTQITCGLETTTSSFVTVSPSPSPNNYGWNVKIKETATGANLAKLTFTVSTPSTGVDIGDWKLLPANSAISASSGITLDFTIPQVLVITIDAQNCFPLVTDGSFNYTNLELTYGGKPYNSPAINIQFVP